jgi:hypothetical protein
MVRTQLKDNPTEVRKLMRAGVLDQNKLISCAKTKMIEHGCSQSFVDSFFESLEDMEPTYNELFRKLKTTQDLISIFKTIELADYKMSYLLIDQFENQIVGLKGESQGKFVNELCDVIDQCKTCLTLIMTITPELASSAVKIDAFSRLLGHPRMPLTHQVTLSPLSLPNTIALVRFYLNRYRSEKTPSKISDLHPFTQDAIKVIFKRGKGLPGKILMECRELLTNGARKGFVTIDQNFVE